MDIMSEFNSTEKLDQGCPLDKHTPVLCPHLDAVWRFVE